MPCLVAVIAADCCWLVACVPCPADCCWLVAYVPSLADCYWLVVFVPSPAALYLLLIADCSEFADRNRMLLRCLCTIMTIKMSMYMVYSYIQCGVVWCGVVWCGVVWCGVVWCGTQATSIQATLQYCYLTIHSIRERNDLKLPDDR